MFDNDVCGMIVDLAFVSGAFHRVCKCSADSASKQEFKNPQIDFDGRSLIIAKSGLNMSNLPTGGEDAPILIDVENDVLKTYRKHQANRGALKTYVLELNNGTKIFLDYGTFDSRTQGENPYNREVFRQKVDSEESIETAAIADMVSAEK